MARSCWISTASTTRRPPRSSGTVDSSAERPAPSLHFDDIDVHVFCGGLKLGDRLRPNCVFSENAYAACEAKGLRVKRHFIDLAAKPQWFLDLVNDYGAKAETPCVLLPGGEFVTDTAKVLARLAPYDGVGMAVEPADVSPGMLMRLVWISGFCARRVGRESHESRRWRPVNVHFHAGHGAADAEKWAESRLKLDKFVDKLRPPRSRPTFFGWKRLPVGRRQDRLVGLAVHLLRRALLTCSRACVIRKAPPMCRASARA